MTATLMPLAVQKFWAADGITPLAGGKVYTYEAGSTTPLASYTDSTGLTVNTNPIILDANGEAAIWISGNYKINVTDADDVQMPNYPQDNVADFHTVDRITAHSTTSVSVSAASKTFTVERNLLFSADIPVIATVVGTPTTNMWGYVTSYSGDQLVVNMTNSNGSGTHSNWLISLSGIPGPTGPTGATGSGAGDVVAANNFSEYSAHLAAARAGLGLGNSAVLDAGTSANQVVQLTAAAKLPAVDGSLLTNLPTPSGIPVVYSGKIVIGAVTVQYGSSSGGSVTFGTTFGATPKVIATNTNSAATGVFYVSSISTSGFLYGLNGGGGSSLLCDWVAIGTT